MKITKTITKWMTGAALAGALLFAAPHKADAQVSFGIRVGRPYYGGYYGYRPYYGGYYARPYPVYGPGYYAPPYGYYSPYYRHEWREHEWRERHGW